MTNHFTGTIFLHGNNKFIIPEGQKPFVADIRCTELLTAMHGDTVKYILTSRGGKVIDITHRAITSFIGLVGKDSCISACNPHIPTHFHAQGDAPPEGHKVVVADLDYINHTCRILQDLGPSGNAIVERKAILLQNNISDSFPNEVLRELEDIQPFTALSDTTRHNLCDLRSITIDPEGSRDFDDALSIDILHSDAPGQPHFRVGVHIADPCYFFPEGSPIDLEAYKRGNSTYLVDHVVPMLPPQLSTNLASLTEGVLRPSKTVFLEYTVDGEYLGSTVINSYIRSYKRLSYEQAQYLIVDGTDLPPEPYGNPGTPLSDLSSHQLTLLRHDLQQLWSLARILRERRLLQGSFNLETSDISFRLDKEGLTEAITLTKPDESHYLVEEFMLEANTAIAAFLEHHQAPYLSRYHAQPDVLRFHALSTQLQPYFPGLQLDTRQDISNFLATTADNPAHLPFRIKLMRAFPKAQYCTYNQGHYGLNKALYAHFTSPIRRYADLINHRQINAILQSQPLIPQERLHQIATHLATTERVSAKADAASRLLKTHNYLTRQPAQTYTGIVSKVTKYSLSVEIPELNTYGEVSLTHFPVPPPLGTVLDLKLEYSCYDTNTRTFLPLI